MTADRKQYALSQTRLIRSLHIYELTERGLMLDAQANVIAWDSCWEDLQERGIPNKFKRSCMVQYFQF